MSMDHVSNSEVVHDEDVANSDRSGNNSRSNRLILIPNARVCTCPYDAIGNHQ